MGGKDSTTPSQAGVVPFRFAADDPQFCLITTGKRQRWGFPKGIIDPGETVAEAALKEAREEAGLVGHTTGEPLGQYRYRKWNRSLVVTVMLMEVTRTLARWEEDHKRERRWVDAQTAYEMLRSDELKRMLTCAEQRLVGATRT